jgi:TM2 domain-containing membrane protein YozV
VSETQAAVKGPDEKYCMECGAVIRAKAEICPKCGVRQFQGAALGFGTTPGGKSRLAAILFALFLGGLGIHKFYLGRIGWGIVYLLFCWTFVPTVISVIEAILYLTMTDEAFAAKYG